MANIQLVHLYLFEVYLSVTLTLRCLQYATQTGTVPTLAVRLDCQPSLATESTAVRQITYFQVLALLATATPRTGCSPLIVVGDIRTCHPRAMLLR
jgi:hypothetical protein